MMEIAGLTPIASCEFRLLGGRAELVKEVFDVK